MLDGHRLVRRDRKSPQRVDVERGVVVWMEQDCERPVAAHMCVMLDRGANREEVLDSEARDDGMAHADVFGHSACLARRNRMWADVLTGSSRPSNGRISAISSSPMTASHPG